VVNISLPCTYGKWHVGGKIPRSGNGELEKHNMITAESHDWEKPLIDGPQDIGFDDSYITISGIQSPPYSFFPDGYLTTSKSESFWWNKGAYNTTFGKSVILREGKGDPNWDSSKYNQILVNETEAFLDMYLTEGSNDPFFTYAALGAVHEPQSPPDTYMDGTKIAGTYESPHMDMLFEMDKAIGSIVTMIEDRGLAENTIIIFTSDNGGIKKDKSSEHGHDSNGPFRGHKGDVYEGGTRVPMIIRYDGHFPQDEQRWNLIGLQDLYATICELTGIAVPYSSAQDSLSFAEYIKDGNAKSPRQWQASWAYNKFGMTAQSIRKGMFKVVRHMWPEQRIEFFNLAKDISEKDNLVHRKYLKTQKRKMLKKLRKIGACPGRDRRMPFELEGGPNNGKSVTCNWFKEKSGRCKGIPEGEIYCPSVCNRHRNFCRKNS